MQYQIPGPGFSFISFEKDGELLTSLVAHAESMKKMGIYTEQVNVGSFAETQREFLEFHRDNVFLKRR